MSDLHRSPGFEENLTCAARFLGIHTAIPSERMEPRPVVTLTCPNCGHKSYDFAVCKCGEPLCERCDPDPESHVKCLPPERMTPYLLLQDCQLTLLRVKKALREGKQDQASRIADNMERVLRGKAIR